MIEKLTNNNQTSKESVKDEPTENKSENKSENETETETEEKKTEEHIDGNLLLGSHSASHLQVEAKSRSATGPEAISPNQQSTYESRKAARSKREIMEDLSRERFPWEE